MALGGEVHHPVGPEILKGGVDRGGIANVDFGEAVTRTVGEVGERMFVARVGEGIEVEYGVFGLLNELADEITADETGPPVTVFMYKMLRTAKCTKLR